MGANDYHFSIGNLCCGVTRKKYLEQSYSRSADFKVDLNVDPANPKYKEFFRYCGNPDNKGLYLRAMREGQFGNKYSATVSYLPDMKGFANQPYADLKYQESSVDLVLKFEDNAILTTQASLFDSSKNDIYKKLKRQLLAQKDPGLAYSVPVKNPDSL